MALPLPFPRQGESTGSHLLLQRIFDRGPDGSAAYLDDMIPRENWKDMKYDADKKAWVVAIELDPDAGQIDLFSNHRKTITYKFRKYPTYISSPYTRVTLK